MHAPIDIYPLLRPCNTDALLIPSKTSSYPSDAGALIFQNHHFDETFAFGASSRHRCRAALGSGGWLSQFNSHCKEKIEQRTEERRGRREERKGGWEGERRGI